MSYFLSWLINRCNTSVSLSLLPLGEDTLGLETTEVKDGSILGSPGVAGRSTGQPEAAALLESPFIWGKHWLILVAAASAKVQIQRGLGTSPVMIFLLPTMEQMGDPFSRTYTLESAPFPGDAGPQPLQPVLRSVLGARHLDKGCSKTRVSFPTLEQKMGFLEASCRVT